MKRPTCLRAPRSQRDDAFDRWVLRVHDTASGEDLVGIAHATGHGLVRSWHVTDRPEALAAFLKRRGRLVPAFGEKGRTAELGPGLYLGSPDFWVGRAHGKWAFLKTLDSAQIKRLLDALRAQVDKDRSHRWLSTNEHERAIRTIDLVRDGTYDTSVLVGTLANQPYNVAFWKPEFLKPLGIASVSEPTIVEVIVRGRFAELAGSRPPADVLRTFRRSRLQGAFTRASMTSNPEMVVWDPRAIVSARVDQA